MKQVLGPQQELDGLCQDVGLSGQVCHAGSGPVIALDCGGLELSPTLLTHGPAARLQTAPTGQARKLRVGRARCSSRLRQVRLCSVTTPQRQISVFYVVPRPCSQIALRCSWGPYPCTLRRSLLLGSSPCW